MTAFDENSPKQSPLFRFDANGGRFGLRVGQFANPIKETIQYNTVDNSEELLCHFRDCFETFSRRLDLFAIISISLNSG